MKKFLGFLCAVILVFGMAGVASALPIDLYENFYGTDLDDNYISIWEGESVTLSFDLSAVNSGDPLPTTDETSYDPSSQIILSGVLDFTFSSVDWADETVEIYAGFYDGNTLIREQYYQLGWGFPIYHRQYANLQIDLVTEGLLTHLQDGQFDTIILSPNTNTPWWDDNDIRLNQGSLTATAVPEPATILLVGTGLLGIIGFGRKRFNKKA